MTLLSWILTLVQPRKRIQFLVSPSPPSSVPLAVLVKARLLISMFVNEMQYIQPSVVFPETEPPVFGPALRIVLVALSPCKWIPLFIVILSVSWYVPDFRKTISPD